MGKRNLTKRTIVDAALEIADREGLKSLSMRRLGDALGVEAMSIYYHVPNKECLLDELVDSVYREIRKPPIDIGWKLAIRLRSISAIEAFARHPWAPSVLDSRVNPGIETLGHLDALIGCFRSAGFSLELTAHSVAVVDAYLFGFVQQKNALTFETTSELHDVAESLFQNPAIREFRHLVDFIQNHALKPGYRFEDEFLWGLDAILDTLEAKLGLEA